MATKGFLAKKVKLSKNTGQAEKLDVPYSLFANTEEFRDTRQLGTLAGL